MPNLCCSLFSYGCKLCMMSEWMARSFTFVEVVMEFGDVLK